MILRNAIVFGWLQCYTSQLNCSYPGYTWQLPIVARAAGSQQGARARTQGREIEAGYLATEL